MVPKSQQRQTLLTMCPCKAEQFTLNSRQSYDSMLAIVLGKAHWQPLQAVIVGVDEMVGVREGLP